MVISQLKCNEIRDIDQAFPQTMNENIRVNEGTKVNFILNFSFIYFIFMAYFIK